MASAHDQEGVIIPPVQAEEQGEKSAQGSRSLRRRMPRVEPGSDLRYCYDFNHGTCTKDPCRYAHLLAPAKANPDETSKVAAAKASHPTPSEGDEGEGREDGAGKSRGRRRRPRRKMPLDPGGSGIRVCFNFNYEKGCSRGALCQYKHVSLADQGNEGGEVRDTREKQNAQHKEVVEANTSQQLKQESEAV